MDARVENPDEASIGELFGKIVEDGRAAVLAEVQLYKAVAAHRAGKARNGAIALVAALLLLNAGLIAALVGFVLGLAPLIGPVLGGLAVLLVTGIVGFLLVRYGADRLGALGGDGEEQAALRKGERL